MALAEALDQGTAALKRLGDQMAAISGAPVTITVNGTGSDRADAEAIKRGQRTATIDATRKALGL